MNASSPLRRQSGLLAPAPALEESVDENERSNRRSLAGTQKRVSDLSQAGCSPLNESTKFLGEQDIKQHFQICTKLFNENKITSDNVWKLHIIDILKDMLKKTSEDNLQIASTWLDISAKVYGVRVDDVYLDGLKLAGSMARATEKLAPQNNDEADAVQDDDLEEENAPAKKTKTKKKKKRGLLRDEDHAVQDGPEKENAPAKKKNTGLLRGDKSTICKDHKSLEAPFSKLESVFFYTRTNASDTSTISNLLTNVLKTDYSGCKFAVFSKKTAWPDEPDPVVQGVKDPHNKKYPLRMNELLPDIKLSKQFRDFHVDEWNPDEEEKQLAAEKSLAVSRQEEVVLDHNGIPLSELDGPLHDIFRDDHNDDVENGMEECDNATCKEITPQMRGEIAHIDDFCSNITDGHRRSEYSYNTVIRTPSGKFIDQIWAGPSHWKLKFIRRPLVRSSGQVCNEINQHKQIRKKVQHEPYDFPILDDVDVTTLLKKKRIPPTIDIEKITLPVPDNSLIKLSEHIEEFMLKPRVRRANKNQVDHEVTTNRDENPNVSQHIDNEDNNNVDFDEHDVEEHAIGQHQDFVGDILVDAPETVPKACATYAPQAKKMDMKKLREAIWQVLTKTHGSAEAAKVIPTTFAQLFKELPDLLPENMKKELSCALVFTALLHLCNEQNLELENLGSNNFLISGPTME